MSAVITWSIGTMVCHHNSLAGREMRNVLNRAWSTREASILSVSTMLDKECCERRAGLRIGLILASYFCNTTRRDRLRTTRFLENKRHAQPYRHHATIRKFLLIPRCRDRDPGGSRLVDERSRSWITMSRHYGTKIEEFEIFATP